MQTIHTVIGSMIDGSESGEAYDKLADQQQPLAPRKSQADSCDDLRNSRAPQSVAERQPRARAEEPCQRYDWPGLCPLD